MTDARIKLTNTMLNKSIIDANKTVQSFLLEDFGMDYNEKFFRINIRRLVFVNPHQVISRP